MAELGLPQGAIRVLEDNKSCQLIVHNEANSAQIAGYVNVKAYIEDNIQHGVLWVDKIDGKVNPADILTKPCAGGIQFEKQVKVAMGIVPEGFDSPEILKARRVVRSVPRN